MLSAVDVDESADEADNCMDQTRSRISSVSVSLLCQTSRAVEVSA